MPQPPEPWSSASRFDFGGVQLVDTDVAGAVAALVAAARSGAPQGLHLCNAYTLALASRDAEYLRTLAHDGAVNLPDGTPVSWFYRLSTGRSARGPVRGPSLMKAALAEPGVRHFLLGGSPQVLDRLADRITAQFPEARLVGRLSPPFGAHSDDDLERWAADIRASGAEIVWIGLGTPKQDDVIARLVGRTGAVLVGVGAAFDFLSGEKREAPKVLHSTGLEWVYRLATEPRRLWRRYLVGNSVFVGRAAQQLARGRRR